MDHGSVRVGSPPCYRWLKRRIDVYLALVGIVLTAPLMLWIAWRIRRDSPGPVLFRQTRAGQYGRPFTLLKFRTMRSDVDPFGDSPHDASDPRITPFGRFLREHSLDELPQLFNVLAGQMSLVGPRPLYLQQVAEWDERQRARLLVKPGLTGLAQVRGRAALTIEEKLEYDVRYVESQSLRTDVRIVLETLRIVGRRDAIYEVRYSRRHQRRSEALSPHGRQGT